jgi:His-Xaa-Ser system protein HxsD
MPVSSRILFSSKVYSLETIKKAAYRFADVMSVDFEVHDNEIVCTLRFALSQSEADLERIIASFRTEVLDQDLRSIISVETAPIRNVILAHAFSKTGLQGGE